jgi:hypothetical protein
VCVCEVGGEILGNKGPRMTFHPIPYHTIPYTISYLIGGHCRYLGS